MLLSVFRKENNTSTRLAAKFIVGLIAFLSLSINNLTSFNEIARVDKSRVAIIVSSAWTNLYH